MKSLSHVRLFATLWTVAHQAPPSMEFSRQEYWSGLSFLSPGDLPDPWIKLGSPTLQADALPSEPPEKFVTELFSNQELGSHSKPFLSHCYTSKNSSRLINFTPGTFTGSYSSLSPYNHRLLPKLLPEFPHSSITYLEGP